MFDCVLYILKMSRKRGNINIFTEGEKYDGLSCYLMVNRVCFNIHSLLTSIALGSAS